MESEFDFAEVIDKFGFEGDFKSISPYGLGHINDTYKLSFEMNNGQGIRYILQRINTNVFKTPER